MTEAVDELIERATKKYQQDRRCFVDSLDPKAKKFLEKMQQVYAEGKYVNVKETHRIFREVFGIEIGIAQVGRHVRKDCQTCERREASRASK